MSSLLSLNPNKHLILNHKAVTYNLKVLHGKFREILKFQANQDVKIAKLTSPPQNMKKIQHILIASCSQFVLGHVLQKLPIGTVSHGKTFKYNIL